MTLETQELRPACIGAEILVSLAHKRFSGSVQWQDGARGCGLLFVAGRPQVLSADGGDTAERSDVIAALHSLALADHGRCEINEAPLSKVADRESLRIDTLGEVLVCIMKEMQAGQLDSMWAARKHQVVGATGLFERLSAAVGRVSGLRLERPSGQVPIASLIADCEVDIRRSWAALLIIGGLEVVEDLGVGDVEIEVSTPEPSPQVQEQPVQDDEIPADPQAAELVGKIQSEYAEMQGKTHYEVLGISIEASAIEIEAAYLVRAKQWHSDKFAGKNLGKAAQLAQNLFVQAEEAHRILTDDEKRQEYDFVLERQAKGLPTDPQVILRAEDLFRKAHLMVRQGNAAGAEPLLSEAVELNPGEPEFWAYLAWALYCAKGRTAMTEVEQALAKAEESSPELDVVFEFRGRIARVEGDQHEASRMLRKALVFNPDNRDAARELRLLTMRKAQESDGGLLGKVKKLFGDS